MKLSSALRSRDGAELNELTHLSAVAWWSTGGNVALLGALGLQSLFSRLRLRDVPHTPSERHSHAKPVTSVANTTTEPMMMSSCSGVLCLSETGEELGDAVGEVASTGANVAGCKLGTGAVVAALTNAAVVMAAMLLQLDVGAGSLQTDDGVALSRNADESGSSAEAGDEAAALSACKSITDDELPASDTVG